MISTERPLTGLDELINHLYHGALEPHPWQTFLANLRAHSGCDAAIITLRGTAPNIPVTVFCDWQNSLSTFDTETYARLAHLDPLMTMLRRPGDYHSLDEMIARSDLEPSRYYREFLLPQDIRHQLSLFVRAAADRKIHLHLFNRSGKCHFGDAEKRLLRAIHSHLYRAAADYLATQSAVLQRGSDPDLLNRLTLEYSSAQRATGHWQPGKFNK